MKSKKMFFSCTNCNEEFEGNYYPGSPDTYWEQGDAPELEIPEECPHCNHELDEEQYHEVAAEKFYDLYHRED